MSKKLHINPETDKVGVCRAQIRCQFQEEGAEEVPHFSSHEEAYQHLERKYEAQYDTDTGMSKSYANIDALSPKPSAAAKGFAAAFASLPLLGAATFLVAPPLGAFLTASMAFVAASGLAVLAVDKIVKRKEFNKLAAKRDKNIVEAKKRYLATPRTPEYYNQQMKSRPGMVSVASSETAPADLQKRLAKNSGYQVRETLADNRKITAEAVEIILKSDDNSARATLARNPSVSMDALDKLSRDRVPYVASNALSSSRIGAERLEEAAAKTKEDVVFEGVATNPNVTAKAINLVAARSTSNKALTLAAKNPQTSEAGLKRILNMGWPGAAEAAAANPSMSKEYLRRIVGSNMKDYVKSAARKNLLSRTFKD